MWVRSQTGVDRYDVIGRRGQWTSPMKRKVSTRYLRLGMYIVELDCPWESAPFEPPFDLQGFTIQKMEELKKVQGLCRHVYIDPELGVGSTRYISEAYTERDVERVLEQTSDSIPLQDFYPELTPVEEEIDRAQEILNDTHALYDRVTKDIQAGNVVDSRSAQNVVSALVESVLRNPAATAWLVQLKYRDEQSYSHAISVCVLALTLGRFLGLPRNEMNHLGMATLLQDVGKLKLPMKLLNKRHPLTDKERELVKSHVDISVLILKSMEDMTKEIVEIVATHHERFDGSGYPRAYTKTQIGTLAFIAGLADSFEAMVSERPYRGAKTPFQALMELYEERDSAFPGGLIEQFIQCVGIFPVGSFVQLNTNEVGVVVHRNQVQQLKPRVMVLTDDQGNQVPQPYTIDLSAQYLLPSKTPRMISRIVDPKEYDLDPTEFFGADE